MSKQFDPCPFCGGDEIWTAAIRDGREVRCKGCGASIERFHGPNNDTVRRLVEAWNARVES